MRYACRVTEHIEHSGAAEDAPTPGPDVFCPNCGHRLGGLPERGTCPECEWAYEPGTVARRQPPTALGTVVAFGWPLGLFVLAILMLNRPRYLGGDLIEQFLFVIAVFGFLINLPYQINRLRNWDGGARNGRVNLLRTGAAAVMMVISLILLVPFLLLGGCLIIIFAAGH